MNYNMAMDYIHNKNRLGTRPGTDTITELLRRLGNPQDDCKCLHIAGTNGKGSVFSFVQEILMEAGYSVGRYVSPTILDYLERFQINRVNMDKDTFCCLLEKVRFQADRMEEEEKGCPTAFEIETAVAFLYFKERKVDYALIECGMGGITDATNVIAHPVCSVFASISMDHMEFLGNTLTEIATQKAGIIKPNSRCVSAPQKAEVIKILTDTCDILQTDFCCADDSMVSNVDMSLEVTRFCYIGQAYEISLLGEHQIMNAITAIEVVKGIRGVNKQHIANGLRKTKWVGRMTKVSDKPLIYVDGAHNEDAWKYLRKMVNKYFTKRKIIYIIGVLKDKEYDKMILLLSDTMDYAVTITPPTQRGLDKDILAGLLREQGIICVTADDSAAAMELAKAQIRSEDDVILVCGSLSFLSDYLIKSI